MTNLLNIAMEITVLWTVYCAGRMTQSAKSNRKAGK